MRKDNEGKCVGWVEGLANVGGGSGPKTRYMKWKLMIPPPHPRHPIFVEEACGTESVIKAQDAQSLSAGKCLEKGREGGAVHILKLCFEEGRGRCWSWQVYPEVR